MSEIRYDPNCAACRDAAKVPRAGINDDRLCRGHQRAELSVLRAENERLTKENDELADAMQECAAALREGPAREAEQMCVYCHGVGACPRCWGRAAITEKSRELDDLRAELLARDYEDAIWEDVDRYQYADLKKMNDFLTHQWGAEHGRSIREAVEETVAAIRAENERLRGVVEAALAMRDGDDGSAEAFDAAVDRLEDQP